jgi:Flp pilus assembly protein TadB
MTSVIVTYLHRRKSRQAKAQFAASKATWRRLTSSTWGATAATDERKSEDNARKATEGYRQPNRDEADDLAPVRGIAVSVLVGIAMWLAIVALVLLITWFFWGPA